jgi:hypothetical protein
MRHNGQEGQKMTKRMLVVLGFAMTTTLPANDAESCCFEGERE